MTLLISVGLIAATLAVCDTVRRHLIPLVFSVDALAGKMATDALMAFELCATSFEMGAIFEHHGLATWSVGLFCLSFYQIIRWHPNPFPCPYVHLCNVFFSGSESIAEAAIRSGFLLLSGLGAYRVAKIIWSLGLSDIHLGRGDLQDACVNPWSEVPTATAALSEFLGTMTLSVAPRLAAENPTLANNDPVYLALVISAMVVVTVHACLGFSGGMMNPVLASVLIGGCSGQDMTNHVAVYWVGATMGALAGEAVYPAIKRMVYPTDSRKKAE